MTTQHINNNNDNNNNSLFRIKYISGILQFHIKGKFFFFLHNNQFAK